MTSQTIPPSEEVIDHDLGACPYKGLRPYTEADSDYFFGRDSARDLVIANLMASRLTVLCGPSGVGKSSLLRAGVLRDLRDVSEGGYSFMAADRVVAVYYSEWRDDPLRGLGLALEQAVPEGPERDALFAVPQPLSLELLNEVTERLDADIYLILDQFEEQELYRPGSEGDAFAAELGRIISAPGRRISVLLGVREDALAKLDRLEDYVTGIFDNYLRLDHLDNAGARDAIEQPLHRHNERLAADLQVTIEPELVEQLLRELRTGRVAVVDTGEGGVDGSAPTIETPFLQLVMTRLWVEEIDVRHSRVLRRATLNELGGSERIVRTHLDRVMDELTEEQRAVAARIFRQLVTPSGTKFAHTAQDLADYADIADPAELVEVLEHLAAGRERILRPVPAPMDRPGPPRYEIFHDVMAPAVIDWRRRYVTAAEASQRQVVERQRHTRRRRMKVLWMVGVLVVATIAVVTLDAAKKGAQAARNRAEATQALLESALAQASQSLTTDPADSLHRALDAFGTSNEPATRAAVDMGMASDFNRLILPSHHGWQASASYSPGGAEFVTASHDGTADVYDATTGESVATFPSPTPGVGLTGASFSRDGTMIVTVDTGGGVVTYDAASRQQIARLGSHQSPYVSAEWGVQDGRQVVLISDGIGAPAELWDPQRNLRIAAFGDVQTNLMESVATYAADLSPDGTRVVTAGWQGGSRRVFIWEAKSGRLLTETSQTMTYSFFPRFVSADAHQVVFVGQVPTNSYKQVMFWDWTKATDAITPVNWNVRTPNDLVVTDDRRMVALAADLQAFVFDADKAQMIGYIPAQQDGVTAVDVSPDGAYLATGDADGRALIWLARGVPVLPVAELLGHRGTLLDVHFNPGDRTQLATAGGDGAARTWRLAADRVVTDAQSWIVDTDISPDSAHLLTVEDTGTVRIYASSDSHLESTSPQFALDGQNLLYGTFTADDSQVVAISNFSYAPWVWTGQSDSAPTQLSATDSEYLMSAPAASADGRHVAVGDRGNQVVIWDLASGAIDSHLGAKTSSDWITSVEFVPGTELVAGASSDGTVRLWNLTDDAPVLTIGNPGDPFIGALAVSADGAYLATVTDAHVIQVYRTVDGALERTISGPTSRVFNLKFSPDGQLIALGAADGNVHIWQWQDGQKIAAMHRHGGGVTSVDFTPDGHTILTGSLDLTATLITCEVCGPFDQVLAAARLRDTARTPS